MTLIDRPSRANRRPTKADIKKFCLALPGATENVQWGDDLVFKVGGKMFAVLGPLSAKEQHLSFKVSDDSFAILTREPGILPAPYLARAKWVQMQSLAALPQENLFGYLVRSHALVAAGLTRKTRIALGIEDAPSAPPRARARPVAAKP